MQTGRPRKALLLTLLVLALGLGGTEAAHADAQYRFFQFNMCGQADKPGCTSLGANEPIVGAVRDSIESFKPAGVSLNEVCYSQYTELLRQLQARGIWALEGRFITTNSATSLRCEPHTFGNAVLSRKPILSQAGYPLAPTEGNETRRMICVRAAFPIQTRLCSVHITPTSTYKDGQIAEVTRVVNQWVAQNGPVVLMGDFNVVPTDSRLNRLYDASHANGHGNFQEVEEGQPPPCRCGESTIGSLKYDYVFVSARHWRAIDGDATFSDHSDHDPLRGWAWLIF